MTDLQKRAQEPPLPVEQALLGIRDWTTDYDNTPMVGDQLPRHAPTCADLRALASALRTQRDLIAEQAAEIERLRKDAAIGQVVRQKMTSGNAIPVERCVIKRDEIDAAMKKESE